MLRLAHRGDWRHAPGEQHRRPRDGAGRPRLRRRRIRRPAVGRWRPGAQPRRDARPGPGSPRTASTACEPASSRTLASRSLADALRGDPPQAIINVDLKGLHDRAVVEVLAAGRGPGLVNGGRLVVHPRDPRAGGGPRPCLAALARTRGTCRRRRSAGPSTSSVRRSRSTSMRSRRGPLRQSEPPDSMSRPGRCAAGRRTVGCNGSG